VKLRQCGDVIAAACGFGPGFSGVSADTPVTVLRHHRSASSESERTVGSVGNGGGDEKKRCMGPPSQ
jgi:cyclin D6, plant